MMNADDRKKIEDWMRDIVKAKRSDIALVFDKDTKQLIPKSPAEAQAQGDRNIPFGVEEARRYSI